MKYTFQHFVDVKTSADSLTMIQIQAGGTYAMQRIKHLLGAYKYVKLGRVSIKLLPASTLPVDPLGLSYDDTDPQTVDPRDQMNPGLVRITNGEDIVTDFTSLNETAQEQMYINTMLDPRWSKFMLQSGFKRSAVPLYWTVGQLAQDPYPGAIRNLPMRTTSADDISANVVSEESYASDASDAFRSTNPAYYIARNSDPRGFFQTGHRGRMGWMPTDAFYSYHANVNSNIIDTVQPMLQPLPEVNVITCLFPKAYKTIYYYRMFITETVYLSGLKNTGVNYGAGDEYRAVDNFTQVQMPSLYPPYTGVGFSSTRPSQNTGGGDQ